MFFKPDQTIASYQRRDAPEPDDVRASIEFTPLPTAVLINRDSASMSELLAAAFKAHGRGVLIGESTFGKGVGQTLYPVLDEGRLQLVQTTYFFPGTRESWNGAGIEPDVEISLTDQARERLDFFLEAESHDLTEQWTVDHSCPR